MYINRSCIRLSEGNKAMGIPRNTFGSSKLHSEFDQNINITPTLLFDVDDECGRDKERSIPKTDCEVKTMGCFVLANTHFEAVLMTTMLKKTKNNFLQVFRPAQLAFYTWTFLFI